MGHLLSKKAFTSATKHTTVFDKGSFTACYQDQMSISFESNIRRK
jgi:hypothetical protein